MGEISWWWLSFCDQELPRGEQFLGALLIEANGMEDAMLRSHALGLNPGGEILGFQVPEEYEYRIDKSVTYRLLSRAECDAFEDEWRTH